MDKQLFDEELTRLRKAASTNKKNFVLMVVSNVVLAVIIAFNYNRERVVIVPQVAPESKIWVSQSQASLEYLTIMSKNMLDLLLNITPETTKSQHKELLRWVAPKSRDLLESKLASIDQQLISNNLSQNFYVRSIRVVNNKNIVYVNGTLSQYIDKNLATENSQTYKITYQVSNYNVQLLDFEQVADNDPQLREVLK